MSRIARNSVNRRLNRNTFCSGAEVAPVQCKRGLKRGDLNQHQNGMPQCPEKGRGNIVKPA